MRIKITTDESILNYHGFYKGDIYHGDKTDKGCVVLSDIGETVELSDGDFIELEASE